MLEFATTADEVTTLTDDALARADELVAGLVSADDPTWDTVLAPLDELGALLGEAYGRGAFLAQVHPDPELRDAGRAAQERLSRWQVGLVFRDDLYAAVSAYAATAEAAALTGERARFLAFLRRDLRRAGHELAPEARATLREHSERLVEIGIAFQRNLADADDPLVLDEADLAGLPAAYVESLDRDDEGHHLVRLTTPDVTTFLDRAERRDLRRELDRRWNTRAEHANRELLLEAVRRRAEMAALLGQPSWAHHTLEERMADGPEAVQAFYDELLPPLTAAAREELAVMQPLLAADTGDEDAVVERWDWRYYHARLQRDEHGIDRDEVAAHFPLDAVVDGLLALCGDVFGIDHEPVDDADVWHPDVTTYRLTDRASGEPIGTVHMDLFPREGTFGHAAAFTLRRGRALPDGGYERPVSAIVANLPRPTATRPSLLDHRQVETMFHEYGHILHQVLTRAELARFSGTSVERDFVEAPSQIMQHWTWDPAVLARFARHHETGAPLPDALVDAMVAARRLDVGLQTLRQLHFGVLDLRLHGTEAPDVDLDAVTREAEELTQLPPVPDTCFPATFAHIIGGYDAGYYGYLWAEVIGDDMFRRFAEEGVTSPDVGADYRREILEVGGTRDAADSVRAFLGREPDNTAFLAKLGIAPG